MRVFFFHVQWYVNKTEEIKGKEKEKPRRKRSREEEEPERKRRGARLQQLHKASTDK